jgi:hypothetical protein
MNARIAPLAFGSLVVLAALVAGCGPGKEDASLAPPPPPAKVKDLSLDQAKEAPVLAPGQVATTNAPAPVLPPPTTEAGMAAITKGLTEKEIKEFKETASIETQDTQINLIADAANSFYNENKRAPVSVEELVRTGHLPRLLTAPKGKKYVIDPTSLAVTSVQQ